MKRIVLESGVSRYWWIPLLVGLISLGLGVWTLATPVESMTVLAYAFAIGLIFAGVLNLGYAVGSSRYTPGWGWALAMAIIEILCGGWMLALPEVQVVGTFIFVVGFFIIIAAINALCEAFALSIFSAWWVIWSILLLVATIGLAAMFLFNPIGGSVAVWFWIALSFFTYGIFKITYAFRLRSLA